MKKSILFILSLVILLSSVLTVMASAVTGAFTEEAFDKVIVSVEVDNLPDDMYDDDANVTYDNGTTATTKGGVLDNIAGDGIGDFVGGVVESVFQDEDVSEQVNDKVEGVGGIFSGIFDSLKDIIPSTNKQTTGSNFFDPITPAVTGGFSSNFGTGNVQQNGTISSTNAALNGEYVDYNTTIIPYAKPTGALNPGDKSDGVKWLQWILIYTECGLQNPITGDYDDATATAVKTLQLKYGMTVDGIASNEVIEKAEQMYNDYINGISGQNTSSPAVFNTVGNTNPQGDKKQAPDITVTVIIVVLVIVWIFAIAAVFIIVHIKRKNITLSEDGEIVKPEKERRKKNTRRTRELTDSVELKPSATLISLADDEEVDDNSVKSLFDRRKDELISKPETDDNTNEVQQKETVSQEVTKSDKVSKTQIDDATTEENLVEVEAAEEKGNVSVEEQTSEPEQETVVETEQEQVSVEEPIKEQDTETPKDSEKVTFEVVDVPVNFNSFNEFDYSDDAEIKPSLSLHEMKQRKKKLEEEARKNIVNSSDSK